VNKSSRHILASVRGLERRPYIAQNPSGILPLPNEVRPVYLRRQIRMCAARLADDRIQNNEKVNQMALAHCATKNFLGGLVALAVLGTCFAMTVKNPSEDLIQTLRKNHDLYELHRRARKLTENAGDLHGSARWASEQDIRETGLLEAKGGA
jgi:hypothetical protein